MRRAFKYRLFVNANQTRELDAMLETHRRLYNQCLHEKKAAWESERRAIRYEEQSARYKAERATNHFYARLNFSSAQATMRRLDKAFVDFFRRVKAGAAKPGYPKFKGSNRFDSIEFPTYRDGVRLLESRLYVQHVGTIRVKLHRPVEGTIKTATLKRAAGNWYVILSCELADVKPAPRPSPAVGIDLGITHFLTTSEGTQEPNPRYLRQALPEMRRASRTVERRKRGGKNRRKAVRCLQRLHVRVANQRREHHHRVACRLVRAYGFIAAESLDIKNMMGNRRLSQAISDAGWCRFLNVLRAKAEKAGAQFVEVNPTNTSQMCSACGQIASKTLAVRQHDCSDCGLSLDRDHNAAMNILARGLVRTVPAGVNAGREATRPLRSRRSRAMV